MEIYNPKKFKIVTTLFIIGFVCWVWPKSLYRSRAGRYFYGIENEIWAGFGRVGNTEKKIWVDYKQLLGEDF